MTLTTYKNPIIQGFAPDPSVVRVDGYFFLVTSSFHVFPGIPLYVSQDWKQWTHIGNVINQPSQLSFEHCTTHLQKLDTGKTMVASGGLWAPTIRYHKGTFYVICTMCVTGGEQFDTRNFFVSTTDIWSNNWSHPIFYDFKGIDPSLFFDDDDRAYVQGCWELTRQKQPSCTIKQFEIDITTGKQLTDIKEIWSGSAKIDTEGPHIYRKDRYYYLMVAEGGTFEHHMLSIARSKNIWGPYESYQHNPILTSDGKDEHIQNTGHGDLVQDATGQWWAVCLGIRDLEGDRHPIGRETFLTPVSWPEGGWPEIQQPQMSFEHVPALSEVLPATMPPQPPYVDDLYIRNATLTDYNYLPSGLLRLKASKADLSAQTGTTTFLGKRQTFTNSIALATLRAPKAFSTLNLKAGLGLYKDSLRHATISFDWTSSTLRCTILNGTKDPPISIQVGQIPWHLGIDTVERIHLRIKATELAYDFQYRSEAGTEWTRLGTVDALETTAQDFTGPLFGVFANGSGKGEGCEVTFETFEILAGTGPP